MPKQVIKTPLHLRIFGAREDLEIITLNDKIQVSVWDGAQSTHTLLDSADELALYLWLKERQGK